MPEPVHSPLSPAAGWLPIAEEPAPPGNITGYSILRNAGVSVVCSHSGDVHSELYDSTGLYVRDTRHLSRFTFRLGGLEPSLLDATDDGTILSAIFTNPRMESADGRRVEERALMVRRRRVITDGLTETLTISNYAPKPIRIEFEVSFDADFRDIFEVRGYERQTQAAEPRTEVDEAEVTFRYVGADSVTRTTVVGFQPPPTSLSASAACYSLELEPHADYAITLVVGVGQALPAMPIDALISAVRDDEQRFLASATRVETDSEAVNALIDRSLLDVRSLLTRFNGQTYVAAGVPWFDTLFGRDSLIAGMLLVSFTAEPLRTALLILAQHQADSYDAERDAAPGKIPHELRWGELAQAGELPFGRYYGSVDATPLYLIAALEYYRWTRDADLIRQLWPTLEAALSWCLESLSDGLLTYQRRSVAGLENQAWKDSHDAVMWPDGHLAEPPLALVEVQGYVAAAFAAYAELALAVDHPDSFSAADRAAAMVDRIAIAFADPELGCVFSLDADHQPVPTPTSNAGHLLWAGAVGLETARTVGARLMEPDLFSGWGVRTMGTGCAGFSPLGYHTGSVWPHDNAMIVGGLRRYGLDEEAILLSDALLQAALHFPGLHVPELFSGDARDFRLVPTPYPVASRPQAWSAASVPYIVSTLLGLRPTKDGRLAVVRPRLPMGVNEVQVSNLAFRGSQVDLVFRRHGSHTSVEILDIRGDADIALTSAWPDALLAPATTNTLDHHN